MSSVHSTRACTLIGLDVQVAFWTRDLVAPFTSWGRCCFATITVNTVFQSRPDPLVPPVGRLLAFGWHVFLSSDEGERVRSNLRHR